MIRKLKKIHYGLKINRKFHPNKIVLINAFVAIQWEIFHKLENTPENGDPPPKTHASGE
jgi:hypothetical protein